MDADLAVPEPGVPEPVAEDPDELVLLLPALGPKLPKAGFTLIEAASLVLVVDTVTKRIAYSNSANRRGLALIDDGRGADNTKGFR